MMKKALIAIMTLFMIFTFMNKVISAARAYGFLEGCMESLDGFSRHRSRPVEYQQYTRRRDDY